MKRKRSESPSNSEPELDQSAQLLLNIDGPNSHNTHSPKRSRKRLEKAIHLHIPSHLVLTSTTKSNNTVSSLKKPLHEAISGSMDDFPVLLLFRSRYSFYDVGLLQTMLEQELSQCPLVSVRQQQHDKQDHQHDQNQDSDQIPEAEQFHAMGLDSGEKSTATTTTHAVYDGKSLLAKECRVLDPIGGGSQPVDCIVIVDSQCQKIGTVVLGHKDQASVLKQLKYFL